MSVAIETRDLTKHFGAVVGVEELNLEIETGEVFGFLGANGSGKTTTIRLLLDLLRPTRGRAFIHGLDCRDRSLDARRLVGYLPSEVPIHPEISGTRFLEYLERLGRRPVSAAHLERLLRRFNISDVDQRRKLRELSHGMKRKLGIVQALMTKAPVLILDEPTAGLDPLMIEAFCETITELRHEGGTTVFLSSHVLSEVERLCDRVGLIRHGRLTETPSIDELRKRAPRVVIVEFHKPVTDDVEDLPGARFLARDEARWVVELRGPIGAFVASLSGLPIADLRVEESPLTSFVLGEG